MSFNMLVLLVDKTTPDDSFVEQSDESLKITRIEGRGQRFCVGRHHNLRLPQAYASHRLLH